MSGAPKHMVVWRGNLLTARVLRWEGAWALVVVVPDLAVDVDARVRKFFTPGKVLRIHRSSLQTTSVDQPHLAVAA